jgi:hypothetical protein
LRQFVKGIFTQNSSGFCESGIPAGFRTGPKGISVDGHRAKLVKYERIAVFAGPLLFENGGPFTADLYRYDD